MDFYKHVFTSLSMPPDSSATLLYLIPKCRNAMTLKRLRLIGLCNTTFKIVTKIIVNRIKPFLPSIIGPSQASFLTNRRAFDQAIIIQEYIHHFNKMKGKTSSMILKINLEKAFDKIE